MKRRHILQIFIVIIILSAILISCSPKAKKPDPVLPPTPAVNDPPSTPTYISPENGSTKDGSVLLFRWNRSHDDGAYIVYNIFISEDPTQLATPLYKRVQETNKYIGGLQASKTYYWKVEAMDDLDKTTSGEVWSVFIEQDYTDDAAVPVLPVDEADNCWVNLYLAWEAADFFHDGPVVYDIYMNEPHQLPSQIAHDLSATTLEVTGLSFDTEYSWKIKARNTATDESTESVSSTFRTRNNRPEPTVDIVFPFENQIDLSNELFLEWIDSSRAVGDYYVYGAPVGEEAVLIGNVGESTGCTLNNLEFSTDYYFYVEQRQNGGAVNMSSDIHFTTKEERSPYAPEIVAPENALTDQATIITFSWLKKGDPNDMKVYFDIYTGEDEANLQLRRTSVDGTSTTLNGFDTEKKYYWRINARNVDHYESRSRVFSFSTAGYIPPAEPTPTNNLPTKPINEFPNDGDRINENTLFFDWSVSTDVEGNVKYNLYVSENSTFTTPLVSNLTTNHADVNTLEGTKTYYWTVEAFDEQGSSTYSDMTSFVLLGM